MNELLNPSSLKEITSIILAAGQGTRMRDQNQHKVCFQLKDKPVIGHMLDNFAQCGITNNVLVVGQMAEQVMQVTSQYDTSALFCFQAEQRGTGHAAKQAARVLKKLHYKGPILVTAGDKVYDLAFLKNFVNSFWQDPCDLLFVTGPVKEFPTSGRVLFSNKNQPTGIVEVFDIAKFKTLKKLSSILQKNDISFSECKNIVLEHLNKKKAEKAFGDFLDKIENEKMITNAMFNNYFSPEKHELTLAGYPIKERKLDAASEANLSVYLFDAPSLYYAVEQLNSKNAQNEEYLTDVIETLAQMNAKIRTFPVENFTNVMAFNTPEELDKIKKTLAV
jgi:N-acetylgalactosamine kinase